MKIEKGYVLSLVELLTDVEGTLEERDVIFDADGILYLGCYKFRDSGNIEDMYINFWQRIKTMEMEIWKRYTIKNTIISFTSKHHFRMDLAPDLYKKDREKKDVKTLTEKQAKAQAEKLKLRDFVSQVKKLCYDRRGEGYSIMIDNKIESDDRVVDYVNNKGYLPICVDSDIKESIMTECFDYKKWKWIDNEKTEMDINFNTIMRSIVGTHNGTKGVVGLGEVKAKEFVDKLFEGEKDFNDYVNLFPTPEDMLLNYRLVDMSQYKSGKLVMADVKGIADSICPF